MRSFLKTAAGIVLAIAVFVFIAVRIILDVIGYTTSPDDWALLQSRWPMVLEWLFSTPWWVPSLFMAALTGLAAWLLWSGLRGVAVTPAADAPQPITRQEMDAIVAERIEAGIVRHIGALQRETVAETFEASDGRAAAMVAHFEGVTQRLSEGGAALEKLAKVNEAALAATRVVLKEHREATHDLAKELRQETAFALAEQRDFQARMETWIGILQKRIRFGLAGVDQGFVAIIDRERLLELAAYLQDTGDELLGPSNGQPLGDWEAWQDKATDWRRAVENWAQLAEKYRNGAAERVLEIREDDYKQKWGLKDYAVLPDADAVYAYKTLCIISRNFHVERKTVDQCVLRAAFVKPSAKLKFDPDDPSNADLFSIEPPTEPQS